MISIDENVSVWSLGLGTLHTSTIITTSISQEGSGTLLLNVILANTPQVLMSLFYFLYNSLYTIISLVTEWDRFSQRSLRKGLRVSTKPTEHQRETYFLQLPYRYSLPLATFSGGLHWLISQSLFLVNLEVYDPSDSPSVISSMISCGWSPIGVLCVVTVTITMLVFLLVSGGRRLRFGGMPMAGSCSAAISAACHPLGVEKDELWKQPVQWGVVAATDGEPGHCSFSTRLVDPPLQGHKYA